MSNVVAFPKSAAVQRAEAEQYLRDEMRMQFAAACGELQKPASMDTLATVLDRMANVAGLIDAYVAIKKACEQ